MQSSGSSQRSVVPFETLSSAAQETGDVSMTASQAAVASLAAKRGTVQDWVKHYEIYGKVPAVTRKKAGKRKSRKRSLTPTEEKMFQNNWVWKLVSILVRDDSHGGMQIFGLNAKELVNA